MEENNHKKKLQMVVMIVILYPKEKEEWNLKWKKEYIFQKSDYF